MTVTEKLRCSPKPWHVQENGASLPKAIRDSEGKAVCTFPWFIYSDNVVKMRRTIANAYLLAAAPELLSELIKAKELRQQAQEALQWLEELPIKEREHLESIIEWDAPISQLARAIDHTEGIWALRLCNCVQSADAKSTQPNRVFVINVKANN